MKLRILSTYGRTKNQDHNTLIYIHIHITRTELSLHDLTRTFRQPSPGILPVLTAFGGSITANPAKNSNQTHGARPWARARVGGSFPAPPRPLESESSTSMLSVRAVGTMRVNGTFEVRQLARGKIPSASTADGVPEMKRKKKKKRSGGLQMKIKGKVLNLHPRSVLVGRTFGLIQFLDILLLGTTTNHVPGTSTSRGVRWLAGSGARSRVGVNTNYVTWAAPTKRMLPVNVLLEKRILVKRRLS